MSINPNIQCPLNIDQKITQLNTKYQEFNTIGKKIKDATLNQYLLLGTYALTIYAASRFLEEKNIRNISYDDPVIKAIRMFVFGIFCYGVMRFTGFITDKIYDNFYKDPLIAKYVKHDTPKNHLDPIGKYLINNPKDHIDLNFSNERKLNRIEYSDLSNLKMVLNSETRKALPDDVWNVIADFLCKTASKT